LPAIALVTDSVVLTAHSNDEIFETVFARQLDALGHEGDVAFAISTSGSSPNILAGLAAARRLKMTSVLLTGTKNSPAVALADHVLAAAGANTARVQEVHLASYHLICELLDARFTA
jgi:D-sedoheptulose 7-phosphate isomerase